LFLILALATVASHAATGQTIPPPVHLPIVRYDETPPFCAAVSQIPQSECEALVALYNSTNGPGWFPHKNWLTTNTPCSWHGVTCQSGHVSHLYPNSNHLIGSIPPELSQLAYLRGLNLVNMGNNRLSGPIPPELGQLTNLQSLHLGDNQLSGPIPPELGQLTNLGTLWLNGNQLSGPIPPELGQLANLQALFLNGNQLSGPIPPELGQLANLQALFLNGNQLSGPIPPVLGQLTNLGTLYLNHNQLSGPIPAELGNLARLRALFLGSNQLRGLIPPQLANLSGLGAPTQGGYRPPGLSLSYNALMATDPALLTFLGQKQSEWDMSQTVTPTSLQASILVSDTIEVTWTPIRYTGDDGYYEISYATDLAGSFTVHGVTLDKTSSQYTLTELAPDTRYFVRVRTYTPAHENNQNELWSDYSSVAFVATHAVYLPIIAQ
jgi:hypothetical protein